MGGPSIFCPPATPVMRMGIIEPFRSAVSVTSWELMPPLGRSGVDRGRDTLRRVKLNVEGVMFGSVGSASTRPFRMGTG